VTALLRRRLSRALHWPTPGPQRKPQPDVFFEALPVPEVLFKVTPTFYRREPASDEGTWSFSQSAHFLDASNSDMSVHRAASGLSVRPRSRASPSLGSLWGQRTPSVDACGSWLSLRGAEYTQIVEEEKTCWLCFAAAPDSVLLECGHAGLCCGCAVQLLATLSKCPICREQITQAVLLHPELPLPMALFCQIGQSGPSQSSSLFARPGQVMSLSLLANDLESSMASVGPPWPWTSRKRAVVTELLSKKEATVALRQF
jgi:hypothetical protein